MGSNMNLKNFSNEPPNDGNNLLGNFPLTRQLSIYSLTFDEFQSTVGGIGKDFGSMNMDELLKNIWSAEESQTIVASSSGNQDGTSGLQRQGSSKLPRTLSQKTVDEVWKDISKVYNINDASGGGAGQGSNNLPQRQQTLGEMTLEEFLVRAGFVREDVQFGTKLDNNVGLFADLSRSGNNTALGIGYQQMAKGPNLMGNQNLESGNQINIQSSNMPSNVNRARLKQQQQIFPKHPIVAHATQMPLQSSPGIKDGIVGMGDQSMGNTMIQSGALQGAGMGMVGLGAGPVVATGSLANQLSSELGSVMGIHLRFLLFLTCLMEA